LAPEYPFPVGIEDCVAAVLWIWQHADEFNVDISRTAFSGFSAGGNLTFTVALRLHDELKRMEAHGELKGQILGKIVHLVAFYPSTDWTRSRAERDASNPNLIPVIPATLYKLFDESYLYPLPDFSSPLLSPGLAPDALLRDALPDRLVIINCSGDQLLAESEKFRAKLKDLGKTVDGYTVKGVGHAWDKQPSFLKGNSKRDDAYRLAAESLQSSLTQQE
jgi:acetyl esterase/lipase